MTKPKTIHTQLKNLKTGTYANLVFFTLQELLAKENVLFVDGDLTTTARNSMKLSCDEFKMLDVHSGFVQYGHTQDRVTLNVKNSEGNETETEIFFKWHWLIKSVETFDYVTLEEKDFGWFDEEVVIYEDGFLKAGCRDVSSDDFELMMVEWSKVTGREVTIAEEA